MQQTSHYQLNQWDAEDRIQREDFNADNMKTDQALAQQRDELVALTAAAALYGNCKIVYGSYTGTGKYGRSNQNQLTFSAKPLLVIVEPETVENNSDRKLRMLINVPYAVGLAGDYNFTNTVSWTDLGVKWYSTGHATGQFNVKDAVYRYVALLAAGQT